MRELKIGAGGLRETVEIESASTSTTAGEQTRSYASEGTFRANVAPVRAQGASGEVDSVREVCNFTFRRHSITEGVTVDDRLTWQSRKYHVISPPHLADLQFVMVQAERRSPNAVDD